MTVELEKPVTAGDVLIEAHEVSKTFGRSRFRSRNEVAAVQGVSLHVARHETLGIVGESGSGKSTLARLLVSLLLPDSGHILVGGDAPPTKGRAALRKFRARVQMVFQDPYGSLDPHRRVRYSLREPLVVQGIGDDDSRNARVDDLLDMVGLGHHLADRYPAELSGGQRQRVAVARALAVSPEAVVCDEPVSALDVSTQAQVVNLLKDLQSELGVALVFITHDISVVRNISHRIAVMHHGRIVETDETEKVLDDPQDEYTRTLLRAVPGRRLAAALRTATETDS